MGFSGGGGESSGDTRHCGTFFGLGTPEEGLIDDAANSDMISRATMDLLPRLPYL